MGKNDYAVDARNPVRSTALAAAIVLAMAAPGRAEAIGQTAPAGDLPREFAVLWPAGADGGHRWTLIGENAQAQEQEKLHPELNVVRTIWHLPLSRNRSAFKVEFSRPVRKAGNVFHLYVMADGDPGTGRRKGGSHTGVDATFTLIDGDPHHASTRLDVYAAEGRSRRGASSVVIRDRVLYIAAEMTLRQEGGRSAFDYHVSSYVRGGPSTNMAYRRAVSDPAPQTADTGLLANPDMIVVDGALPGWRRAGKGAETAVIAADPKEKAAVIDHLYAGGSIVQSVSLAPGHYLLRALARSKTFAAHLAALSCRIPIGTGEEYRWVELPFCVCGLDPNAAKQVDVGIAHVGYPPTRHHGEIRVRKMELVRLGDTVLPERWAEQIPADRLHRLRALAEAPEWGRPGKVVFQDSFVGTELWLMTQEGQVDHSYVGFPDFSHNGKYLHIGLRRAPRGVLRTDGSARHLNAAWQGIVWLFPWEEKRLPAGSAPDDWIVASRSPAGSELFNLATGQSHRIALPARAGWSIVHFPGMVTYGGRGPKIRSITHESLVWLSEDGKSLGRSTVDGEGFCAFKLRSLSARPADDTLHPSMSSVWGKAGDNWRDAVDRDGRRYFLFELNRDNFPDHPTNPYQVWALPLTEADGRGLLRVVFNPKVKVTEYLSTHSGMTPQPSFNWWDLAAGLPRSGDNAILVLEDGTLVHMSSLGMHSSFQDTIQTNCPYRGDATFIGSFPRLDRITWPHEFRRDRDFAVVASHAEPASALVMLDLEHTTMSAAALTLFHDYAIRYKTRWDKTAYHKPMFRPAPKFSPDFTKIVYFSSMLTGDRPDRKWADVYMAVVRYPQPPVNVRQQGDALVWERPPRDAEIRGFRLYRSRESGGNYHRVGDALLAGTRYDLPPDGEGCYVLTSVEHSGLEGRMFSQEVRVGAGCVFRHFARPAAGTITQPMVPLFDPGGAGDAYAVAITDPELVAKRRLGQGLSGSVTLRLAIPQAGPARILARVRGLSALERATYMTGWPAQGDVGRGKFAVCVNGKPSGQIPVDGSSWHWAVLDAHPIELPSGAVELRLATSDAGIAVDNILVTNDFEYAPRGRGQVPESLAAAPARLRAEPLSPDDHRATSELVARKRTPVKLAWEPLAPPQGVSHYNVYRSGAEAFEAEAETLLGSPTAPVFYDVAPEPGQKVFYRVRAVDAWGNRSPASAALAVTGR